MSVSRSTPSSNVSLPSERPKPAPFASSKFDDHQERGGGGNDCRDDRRERQLELRPNEERQARCPTSTAPTASSVISIA